MKSSAWSAEVGHLGWQPYRGALAGIVQRSRQGAFRRRRRQTSLPQPLSNTGVPGAHQWFREPKTQPTGRELAFAAAFACLLAGLALVAWPGERRLGARPRRRPRPDRETPPPSCPGKIVNGVEVIPCRVEGHVTGFQAMAGGVAAPYEAPFDGKIVAWSITLARPRQAETKTTTDEIGFFNDFLGTPLGGADRRPAPGRRKQAAQIHARPPEPAADPQPLLRRQGRSSPSSTR